MPTSKQPHLPHDQDERASSTTAPDVDPGMDQARRDIESGQVDTDLRQSPGLDAGRRPEALPEHRKNDAQPKDG